MDEAAFRKELEGFFAIMKGDHEPTGWYTTLRTWADVEFDKAYEKKREGWRNGVFDSEAIVNLANSGTVRTPQALANKLGIPLDGPLKRRLNCLVTKDELISEEFLAY